MTDKVFLDEHPAAADFGGRDLAGFSPLPQFLCVHSQEMRCLLQIEGPHDVAMK